MDPDDIARFNTQRASEVAAPLVHEIARRLGLDLRADDNYCLRIFSDFAARLFEAGYTAGITEAIAQVTQQLPPNINIGVAPPTAAPRSGPLGEGSEWENLDDDLDAPD